MTLYRSMGAALEDDGSGTNPLDVRKGIGSAFTRAGVLPGASTLVAGQPTWSYMIAPAAWVTQTATGDGLHLWGNDGNIWVSTDPAPSTGLSRIDIIWVRHPSNGENADTTSAPAAGVTKGTASSTPIAPALPSGAFELARNTMTSAATSTSSAGNTIAQTAPFTAVRGGVIPVRSTAERDALTSLASATNPIMVNLSGTIMQCSNGSSWQRVWTTTNSWATVPTAGFRALSGHTMGTVRISGDRVFLDAGRVQRSSGTLVFADTTTRYEIASAMQSVFRPAVEVSVMTTGHFASGTPVPIELHVTTSGSIEVRATVAPATLGSTGGDWIAIPPLSWPAP